MGEKTIVDFVLESSQFALSLMEGSMQETQIKLSSFPESLESMAEYIQHIILPIIQANDAAMLKKAQQAKQQAKLDEMNKWNDID
jgi:hypothetical protein